MNRMEEYGELRMELEKNVPDLNRVLERARKRKKCRQRVWGSAVGMAASFVLFVMLVNFSSSAAYACAQIPILRELAEVVKFSRSLSDAVENEYVQELDLVQEDGDVSVKVEYLIVDQKQVNVFYRLYSKKSSAPLNAEPYVLSADQTPPPPCVYRTLGLDLKNGELKSVSIDFAEEDVPEQLLLRLKIYEGTALANEREYIAEFDFLLEFDPLFTEAGKEFSIKETVVLDEQKITITSVEVYPTHMRINIEDDANNTAWLKKLYFYIVTDTGEIFNVISKGLSAIGGDSPTMTSFLADSTYFYEAKIIKLVITGAQWLSKDSDKVHINLENVEADGLPEGVELISTKKLGESWIVRLRAVQREENYFHEILEMKFYDETGSEYDIRQVSYSINTSEIKKNYFIVEMELEEYQGKEVWMKPVYSHEWSAKKEVIVDIY